MAGWLLLLLLDGRVDLASQALVLVATAAVATLWLPAWSSAAAACVAVAAFNWTFVPPRYSFSVDLEQHALLLATLLLVVWLVAWLVERQRRLAALAASEARREARLRTWSDALRGTEDPTALAGVLQSTLSEAAGVAVALRLSDGTDNGAPLCLGSPDNLRAQGLAACIDAGQALGPGTGRFEQQPDVYLPLRGRSGVPGAAVLVGFARPPGPDLRHLQALCDRMGEALERSRSEREARRLRDEARDEQLRSTLLSAIAHDHRTPLATILGAATSLVDQHDRLLPAQRRQLAQGIAEEAARLARLTDNTLQLARLDAGAMDLHCDWESAEELVGAALARVRRRDPHARVQAKVEPMLPLLWCDPMLVSQLLDNLLDNALKHGGSDAPVELLARRLDDGLLLAVRDRGPGVPAGDGERIFEPFRRGPAREGGPAPGSGLGLAVCRAIARVHGATLRLRPRRRGGSAFECRFPLRPQPAVPA